MLSRSRRSSTSWMKMAQVGNRLRDDPEGMSDERSHRCSKHHWEQQFYKRAHWWESNQQAQAANWDDDLLYFPVTLRETQQKKLQKSFDFSEAPRSRKNCCSTPGAIDKGELRRLLWDTGYSVNRPGPSEASAWAFAWLCFAFPVEGRGSFGHVRPPLRCDP